MSDAQFVLGFFAVVFVGLFIWLAFGYANYRQFKANLLTFKEKYAYYIYMEQSAGNKTTQAQYFIKREQLIQAYPSLYIEMQELEVNTHYWRQTLRDYLLLGLFYTFA